MKKSREYVITTENTCDMPYSFYEENGVEYSYLPCTMGDIVYNKENDIDPKEFYDRMRNGTMPTTSQVNIEDAKKLWRPILEKGYDILHLSFSSGLSGTYNNCFLAAKELMEENSQYKILVVDTLCASMGQGLLLWKALEQKREGRSIDETASWVEYHKKNLCHVFTVDDLMHLHRGGRVSKVSAVLGTVINVKPMLHVDDEGHLILLSKERGRKRALQSLVSMMDERLGSYRDKNDVIYISHGDCEEDALYVKNLLQKKYASIKKIEINTIGSTIGAHAGPGTVAMFFMGDQR
ncbi:DegV family protein [Blautia liquoris]|uniref:DegV family protein n=1 Tax=Blautia liquoris TaxID=2779518 RepID=A0A7M2RHJ7_9FIRM|nr:DegV family protein [Blautia liquoris]QOV19806.1 DegV family protein [Blautia liquoris]